MPGRRLEKGQVPLVTSRRVVGTLGGPGTFAGQATQAMVARLPELETTRFFATMEEIWAAVAAGSVDSVVLSGETTNSGLEPIARQLLTSKADLCVNAEILVPYHCMLLGKPGTALDQVKLVLGHGSLIQCQGFLAERLPWAEVRMHDQNSLAAAAEVLAGDGGIAVVGTLASAEANGLAVLARDIDQGSVGAWWLISRELRPSPRPDVVVVSVSSASTSAATSLLSHLAGNGMKLRGMAGIGTGTIFSYDYLVVFQGARSSVSPRLLLQDLPGCRLVGACESMSVGAP